VHSNVIFNGLSATSDLPNSLPGAVRTDVDVIPDHLRASLRAAGAGAMFGALNDLAQITTHRLALGASQNDNDFLYKAMIMAFFTRR
jgi:hypothetical protein